jgi:hypothetical protein
MKKIVSLQIVYRQEKSECALLYKIWMIVKANASLRTVITAKDDRSPVGRATLPASVKPLKEWYIKIITKLGGLAHHHITQLEGLAHHHQPWQLGHTYEIS